MLQSRPLVMTLALLLLLPGCASPPTAPVCDGFHRRPANPNGSVLLDDVAARPASAQTSAPSSPPAAPPTSAARPASRADASASFSGCGDGR